MNFLKKIRSNPEIFDAAMKMRGVSVSSNEILMMDEKIRQEKTKLQNLQATKNEIAKKISKSSPDEKNALISEGTKVRDTISKIEERISQEIMHLDNIISMLPNIPAEDVPFGESEDDNVVIKEHGSKRIFSFTPKKHTYIEEKTGQMNFDSAAKMSGRRFVILRKDLASMERALTNFMLDVHIKEFQYEEVSVPFLVRDDAMYNAGQLPKFAEDSFVVDNGQYRLIPTGEVPLVNIVADTVLSAEELPMRFVAATPCFRSEAGSAGRDTHGIMRMHQFHKVELVSIVEDSKAEEEHERMLQAAESILQKLGLHYRVSLLCSQDMGFGAHKTYDIEVWLPGENRYREISSCSNCADFQSRRMNGYYKNNEGQKKFFHTLNGSGVAIGRAMVAIIENYQREDGMIDVPEVLVPYMNGVEIICR